MEMEAVARVLGAAAMIAAMVMEGIMVAIVVAVMAVPDAPGRVAADVAAVVIKWPELF